MGGLCKKGERLYVSFFHMKQGSGTQIQRIYV